MQNINRAKIKDEDFAFPSLASEVHGIMIEKKGSNHTAKLYLGLNLSCLTTKQAVVW